LIERMPNDTALTARLRLAFAGRTDIREQKMFGGICVLLNGNMLCGIHRDRLMFRVGKAQHERALARPGARPMDITGRPMAGFVFVDPAHCTGRQLKSWIALAESYVGTLPRKRRKMRTPTRAAARRRTITRKESR
jgi:TfoX/Sxy family transcriptional regulator of competence genes